MAIEQKYTDLINADIDGEISASEKAGLQAFLDDDLSSVCATLDAVKSEEPPPHVRHVIMNTVKPTQKPKESPGFLQILFATSAVKYAVTFAAGVFLTLSIVDSDQISDRAFDDVTGLVGTVSDPVNATLANSISVNKPDLAGTVSLRSAESMLILDFDLVAKSHWTSTSSQKAT
jgi:hypothetical protein